MPQNIYTEFKEHLSDLKSLQHIIILQLDNSSIVEFATHGFCDASERT